MINLIVLGARSYLFRKFLSFCQKNNFDKFKFFLFSRTVDRSNSIYTYQELEEVINKLDSGFILNFAGENVFKTLFSIYTQKDKIIWKSRIDFTRSIVQRLIHRHKDFIFFIPSAVWVYSPYLRDLFLEWEATVEDFKHLIFRLGIVLDYDCQWTSLISTFFRFRIHLIFPDDFIFPFVPVEEFCYKLHSFIVDFSENKISKSQNIDLFYVSYFNDFVSFVKDYFSYRGFFLKFKVSKFLLNILFGRYAKVFYSLNLSHKAVFESINFKSIKI